MIYYIERCRSDSRRFFRLEMVRLGWRSTQRGVERRFVADNGWCCPSVELGSATVACGYQGGEWLSGPSILPALYPGGVKKVGCHGRGVDEVMGWRGGLACHGMAALGGLSCEGGIHIPG